MHVYVITFGGIFGANMSGVPVGYATALVQYGTAINCVTCEMHEKVIWSTVN